MSEPSADILVVCPHCSTRLRVSGGYEGGSVTCPRCERSIAPAPLIASGSSSGEYATSTLLDLEGAEYVAVACPECATGLRVRAKYVGRHVRCGNCRAKFLVDPPGPSVLDAPTTAPYARGGELRPDQAAPTPDPDDPWQGRAEVMKLLDELAALQGRNARLQAEVEHLERERDVALREVARLRSQPVRTGSPAARRFAPAFDDGEPTVPFTFLDETARTSAR
ncbi:hypothetical protein [Paludisphaera mucosa]|uniref:Uncharacterized protein n=1 Tax=Paludisphaera mucosa TaxID=3030827 RepID=A0ABT6FJ63_9BACT|nr:hypothetical protein [Paludisphaera mucosa]MDG3007541.1 hypothetical protein [Paludisphaera mucosa]